MIAWRRIMDSVWACEFEHTGPNRCSITRMWRLDEGQQPGGPLTFAQIERPRPDRQCVVCLVVGPPGFGDEPDWAGGVMLAVDNPRPAMEYGGTSSWTTYGRTGGLAPARDLVEGGKAEKRAEGGAGRRTAREGLSEDEVLAREKACEASRKSRLRRALRQQGKPEEEVRRLVP